MDNNCCVVIILVLGLKLGGSGSVNRKVDVLGDLEVILVGIFFVVVFVLVLKIGN